ncbi:MAG: hypothetical protein QOF30_2451 [Acidimicrobiaceae bacterium]|jgi:hypothetical protein|nr:hypothetical protein [Acidimicrobiaceae bacterium]
METSRFDGAEPASEATGTPPTGTDPAVVHFLGVPIDAYLALQEWNDAVVRECELIAALEPAPADMPARLLELAIRLSGRFAAAREGYREVVAEARAGGTTHVELEGRWPQPSEASVEAAVAFLAMMEELDDYCRIGVLLTEPPMPVVADLRRWFVTEMRAQVLLGDAPTPFRESGDRKQV